MSKEKYQILVLCTGNSARSIMVEALLDSLAGDYFQVYSAGSHPTGKVNPFALEQIESLFHNIKPESKSWNVFAGQYLDFVITVCGNAAQEICPCFAGEPKHIHWGESDPASVTGSDEEKREAFSVCFDVFKKRIQQLIETLDKRKEDLNTEKLTQIMRDLVAD